MVFRSSNSEKRGKEVLKNLYYFPENQMLDCNQYVIVDNSGPVISLIGESDPLELGTIEAYVRVEVTDPQGILSVEIDVGAGNVAMISEGGDVYNYSWCSLDL